MRALYNKKAGRGLVYYFLAAALVLTSWSAALAEEGLIGAGAAAVSRKNGLSASTGSVAVSETTGAMAAGAVGVTASGGALSAGVAQSTSYITVLGTAAETLAGAAGQDDTDAHGHGAGHGE